MFGFIKLDKTMAVGSRRIHILLDKINRSEFNTIN